MQVWPWHSAFLSQMYIPSYVPTLCEGIKLLVENSPFMLRCRSREMRTCSQKASGEADPSRCQNGLKIVMLGCYVMLRPDILCQKINSTNECHVCVIHLSILSCSHTHTHAHIRRSHCNRTSVLVPDYVYSRAWNALLHFPPSTHWLWPGQQVMLLWAVQISWRPWRLRRTPWFRSSSVKSRLDALEVKDLPGRCIELYSSYSQCQSKANPQD